MKNFRLATASAVALIAATGAYADGHLPAPGTLGYTGVGAQSPDTTGLLSPITISEGFTLDLGGFLQAVGTSVNNSGTTSGFFGTPSDRNGVDFYTDFEFHITPVFTLDNGLTIGGTIELEGTTNGDQIDEAYIFAEGDFGRVELGDVNSVGYRLHVTAPYVGVMQDAEAGYPLFGASGLSASVADFYRGTLGTTRIETLRANDATRINYFSPNFNGFTLGVSFSGDARQDAFGPSSTAPGSGIAENFFDVAVQYSGQVGSGVLTASARYGTATSNVTQAPGSIGTNPYVYGVGFNYDLGMISIGGSAAHAEDSGTGDGTSYDFGVSYTNGNIDAALTYFMGENNDVYNAGTMSFDEERWSSIVASGNYGLNDFIDLNAYAGYGQLEQDVGAGFSAETFVIGGGITIAF